MSGANCLSSRRSTPEWNKDPHGKSTISALLLLGCSLSSGVQARWGLAATRLFRRGFHFSHLQFAQQGQISSVRPGNEAGYSQMDWSAVFIKAAPPAPVNGTNEVGKVPRFSGRYGYFVSGVRSAFTSKKDSAEQM